MKYITVNEGDSMADKRIAKKKKAFKIKKPDFKNLKIFVIVALLFAVIIGAAYIFGGFEAAENLLYYSRMTVDSSVISDGGFPVSFTGNDIVSVKTLSGKYFVLSKKMLTCISSDGKPLFTETFTFIEPQLNVGEKYGVVFDRSSSAYILFDKHGVVFRGNTDGERHIIAATVDNKGNCAFSVKSDDSACRVYMADKKGRIKYIWSCSEEYAVSLDISPDSKKIVCGAIGAYSNEVFTKVYCLDITSEDVKEIKLNGSACIDIVFTDSNKAAVSCIDKRVIVDLKTDDGNPVETYYSGSVVQFARDFKGNAVVVTDKINALGSDEITMYDRNNTVIYRSDIAENSEMVCIAGRYTYSLAEGIISVIGRDGSLKESLRCEVLPRGIACLGNDVCYYNLGSFKKEF